MTSDSSAYSLGKPGATTCPTGYMLVVSAEACKQITSIKSGTGVETAMFMGQTGPATFATTSDGGGTTAACVIDQCTFTSGWACSGNVQFSTGLLGSSAYYAPVCTSTGPLPPPPQPPAQPAAPPPPRTPSPASPPTTAPPQMEAGIVGAIAALSVLAACFIAAAVYVVCIRRRKARAVAPWLERFYSSTPDEVRAAAEGTACPFWFVKRKAVLAATKKRPLGTLQQLRRTQPDALVRKTLTREASYAASIAGEIAAVSHRWEDPKTPDTKGVQLEEMQNFLIEHPEIQLLWYDYFCMPQGKRTDEEKAEFEMMLPNINLLYLGATVLVLMDLSYLSRFWTQFEAWCSMQKCTTDGLVSAPEAERRAVIKCIHNAPPRERETLAEMWGHVTAQKAYETLSSPDVTVTNAKDKEMQLPKILKLDENVKEAMIDGAKFVSRATIDLDHD